MRAFPLTISNTGRGWLQPSLGCLAHATVPCGQVVVPHAFLVPDTKRDVQSDEAHLVLGVEKSGRHQEAVGEGRQWKSLLMEATRSWENQQLQPWDRAERCGAQLVCAPFCAPFWRAGRDGRDGEQDKIPALLHTSQCSGCDVCCMALARCQASLGEELVYPLPQWKS